MLLETLDIKSNDLIIFSQNKFDLDNNFKVIYKDDPALQPRPVTYSEVCSCLNEFAPKTIIAYRLLTNLGDLPAEAIQYGLNVYINGSTEIIYLDPVFALKEMEQYIATSGDYNLRFRIQQIGLTTLTRKNKAANFAEVFSVDLTGVEAINQNDKVFVDALLARGVFKELQEERQSEPGKNKFRFEKKLSEDQTYNSSELSKMNKSASGEQEQETTAASKQTRRSFSEFLKKKSITKDNADSKEIASPVLEIFYSNEVLENHIEGKEGNVVLKIDPEK